ncbi:GTPase activating protein for Arf, putative [Paecilomyces variotii No. 5]|uniref:GTPase activating protein for Arf, putative n=1 Tax=Byssochlamys spectabilis (strain No. 5 / NBRC 109023) TaxID=1356009 RepID=V5I473_BYSSN|nr:GTPase activating protein for Arf, putative [Paecilomyces variotii No. 5]
MVAGLSKRQQARNERALQDLIRSIPGNDRCADCSAYNPGWASWNLGIFLCMRCAALHRKLGTHISKVKSLTMDSWTAEQVDNMKAHGNTISNKIYNPRNVKPPIPVDIDEADSAMERYIRQKYEQRSLEDGKPKPPSRHDSGYTRSPEGSPPPLPPKTGKIFGFGLRSVSSASHLPRSSGRSSNPTSPRSDTYGSRSPPVQINKQSRVFGASVGDLSASFEQKLSILKEMGFPDDKRNATVLKGLSGNLEKTIESLARLGENSNPASGTRTPVQRGTPTTAHFGESLASPKPAVSTNPFDQLDSKPQTSSGLSTVTKSYNPFDAPDPQPTSALETSFQHLQVSQPLFPHSTGGYPSQQNQAQALFQQPMTPPVTMPSQAQFAAPTQSLNGSYNPFFQPAPQQQQQGNMSSPYANQAQNVPQSNPFFGQLQPQHTSASAQLNSQPSLGSSPFQPRPQTSQPQYAGTAPPFASSSPFGPLQQQPQQSQQQQQSPFSSSPFGPLQHQTQPQQQQQTPFSSSSPFGPLPQQPQSQQPQPQQQQSPFSSSHNPFDSIPATVNQANPYSQQQMPQMQQQNLQPQSQYLTPQQTGRVDKSSILSLYSIPQAAPMPNAQQQQQQQQQMPQQPAYTQSTPGLSPAPSLITNSMGSTPQTQSPFSLATPQQRSVTMPVSFDSPSAGARNPFFTSSPFGGQTNPAANSAPMSAVPSGLGIGMGQKAQQSNSPFARTHASQASVDINGLQNGRHSPDAFANLSARFA